MTARNRQAVERSQRERAEIRRVWLNLVQRWPFERWTAKDISRRLNFTLALSTVYWHMEQIRLAAAEPEYRNDSNVSAI
jgi:hypothetical protein